MPSDTPTKVLIVDDHEIVRKGLVMLISRQEDLVVVKYQNLGRCIGWHLFSFCQVITSVRRSRAGRLVAHGNQNLEPGTLTHSAFDEEHPS